MRQQKKHLILIAAGLMTIGGTSFIATSPVHAADEWYQNSPYFEEESWSDVTEWLDGNNYELTDEAWWDEAYQANDRYGYSTVDDNDWFYDYYDAPNYSYYSNGYYPYGLSYYDYNYDGYYDAQGWYYDSDGDGRYDNYDYYTFTDTSNPDQQKKMKSEAPQSSNEQTLSGKIQKIKEVQTRGGKHTVVQIQQANKTIVADLGKVKELQSLNLKEGDQISVKGLMSNVGEKTVVMARSIEAAGKQMEINRDRNTITGKIVDSRKVKIRGIEQQFAMVDVPKRGKVAVDLGPVDKFTMDNISKGKELTFSGLPVKVKGKALLIAQSVYRDSKTVQITRPQMKDAKAASK